MVPRLILQFENRVLKEYPAGLMVTIGRLPDNAVMIDNPAVSSHHACVHRDGDQFIVEDLQSTNGTFVNEKRITRHTLRDGDVVLIGKHQIVFDAMGSRIRERAVERWLSGLKRRFAKPVKEQSFRGFESLSLRHASWIPSTSKSQFYHLIVTRINRQTPEIIQFKRFLQSGR